MYQRFYGLQEMPFELTPDPKYLYLSRQHREALSNLEYGIVSSKAITVLIGEAGTGKTTLLHSVLASHRCRDVKAVFISNPTLRRAEFLEMLSQRFELGTHASQSKTAMLAGLEDLLRQRRTDGRLTALVIDEAQSLSAELLEEIRLLANIETSTEKLLPLVLVGQPELRDRLNQSGLRQLKQRITLRCEITPFSLYETTDYIASRIRIAGGEAARLFTRDAVMLIHERSGGIPRTISVLCDNALLTGFGLGQRPVTRAIVLEVARDFDLAGRTHDSDTPADTTISDREPPSGPVVMAPVERAAAVAPVRVTPAERAAPVAVPSVSRSALVSTTAVDRAVVTTAPRPLPPDEDLEEGPEPRLADKVLCFLLDFFCAFGDKLRAGGHWIVSQRRPHSSRLQPTGLVAPRPIAMQVPFRGSDESR